MIEYLKTAWVQALRSGEYKQGKNSLCENKAYCCLGVLSEVIAADFPNMVPGWSFRLSSFHEGRKFWRNEGTNGMNSSYIPDEILDLVDLRYSQQTMLAIMNDSDGRSFEEIADFIEKSL